MIIHCTKKLAAKLPHVSDTPLDEPNPLGSWHANLYTIHRRNCIMLCHDNTRFVLFMAGLKQKQAKQAAGGSLGWRDSLNT